MAKSVESAENEAAARAGRQAAAVGIASGAGSLLWTASAILIAALIVLPVASVVWIALHPEGNVWPHLLATTLPRYLANTFVLMLATGALSAAVGAGAAWLVTMYRFPLSRLFEWLLLMPLAVPAYVGAYAVVDFLDYSGLVQTGLRELMGWQSAQDYAFPEIRSRTGAVIVLTGALYPYVYLLARAAYREQSGGAYEVARSLGAGPVGLFLRVGLPLARPAIAVGAAIVMMETVNDFGVVDFFGVQTLTTGIFTTWLERGDAGAAAQIACIILAVMLALVAIERQSRRRLRFHQSARHLRPITAERLSGWLAALATFLCLVPVAVGFVLPVAVMLGHATDNPAAWVSAGLAGALANTLSVGGGAALLTVMLAIFMGYGERTEGSRAARWVLPVTTIGYAVPGAVLAVGLLIPLAAIDNRIADAVQAATGRDPGLILIGTAAALVIAYVVRFFAIAQGAVDCAFGRVAPSLPMTPAMPPMRSASASTSRASEAEAR